MLPKLEDIQRAIAVPVDEAKGSSARSTRRPRRRARELQREQSATVGRGRREDVLAGQARAARRRPADRGRRRGQGRGARASWCGSADVEAVGSRSPPTTATSGSCCARPGPRRRCRRTATIDSVLRVDRPARAQDTIQQGGREHRHDTGGPRHGTIDTSTMDGRPRQASRRCSRGARPPHRRRRRGPATTGSSRSQAAPPTARRLSRRPESPVMLERHRGRACATPGPAVVSSPARRRTASCAAIFEAGAEDVVGGRRDRRAVVECVLGREGGCPPARRQRADDSSASRRADLRARAQGRHRQDGHDGQPRRRARRAGQASAAVDLDLQFGDLGLALGLVARADVYDLASSGGALDADKVDGVHDRAPVGRPRACWRRLRPDQACARHRTSSCARSTRCCAATYDFVIVDTPPGFTPEVIAAVDASSHVCMVGMLDALSLKNTKLGAGDARADGLRRRAQSRSCSTAPIARSASRSRRRGDRRPSARHLRARATGTSRARSTRACRSSSAGAAREAARAFRELATRSSRCRRPARRARTAPRGAACALKGRS